MSTADSQRNRMRILFLEPEFRSAAWRMIVDENDLAFAKEHLTHDATPRVRRWFDDIAVQVEYEVAGWDALLKTPGVVSDAVSPALRDVYLQLEPIVGDNFPELLRSMKAKFAPTFGEWRALIIDQFEAESVSLDEVRRMFEPNDVGVLTVGEIRAAMTEAARAKPKELA
jgi:hypothetical protein